ncbi:hypothetical protein RSAG8_13798, partial [Rhizoctonia solani AG-8 WAC10335]
MMRRRNKKRAQYRAGKYAQQRGYLHPRRLLVPSVQWRCTTMMPHNRERSSWTLNMAGGRLNSPLWLHTVYCDRC